MFKKTIKYTDYNGLEREEDYYFNLTKAEVMEWELGTTGGLTELIKKIVQTKNTPEIVNLFKEVILKAYGEKTPDGKGFIKVDDDNHLLANKFKQTEAYSTLFMELATNDVAAAEFINGIIPADLAAKVKEEQAKQNNPAVQAIENK